MRVGELLRAWADEVDVTAFFQNQPSSLNGVAQTLDAGHASRLHAAAVHQQGVELDAAVRGEKAAPAGVEGGVVFEDGDGGFNGIQSRSAARKNGIAGLQRIADPGLVGGRGVGGDGPCAAVDEKRGSVVGGSGHRIIVDHSTGGVCISATSSRSPGFR